ncbi:MAG: SBBP repeat-containing protein, partial [Bacteroidia bacterium]|nr:SBBP repeat-containing protein [Bacteroidia bacterium]MDW8134602.1 SBBP repeat-containing protein [Bacteroidia bacterium]
KAYVGGETFSSDFPTVSGSYLTTLTVRSGFLVVLNTGGNQLEYGTFVGGNNFTGISDITLDANGFVYLTGSTSASDFPTTSGSYDTSPRAGERDAFVMKLMTDANLPRSAQLIFSTVFGIAGDVGGLSIALDGNGNVYVAGDVSGIGARIPTTTGSLSQVYGGNGDGMVFKLNPQGTQLLYSTYIGKAAEDRAHAVAVDPAGNVYVAGRTRSSDFPTTTGSVYQGDQEGFIMRFNMTMTPASLSWGASVAKGWKAYPVPVHTGKIWIENTREQEGYFELWNVQGQQVQTWSLPRGTHEIKLNVAPGAYLLIERESGTGQYLIVE